MHNDGIRIKNARNTMTKSRGSFKVRQRKEKRTKAESKAAAIVTMRSCQSRSGCSNGSAAGAGMSRRKAYATRLVQPMKNRPSAMGRPSSDRQKRMAGKGNKMQPSQAGKR